jgi:hypothetical protein
MNPQMIKFLKCAVEVFPGWVQTMDKHNLDKVSHTEFAWRLMPKTHKGARLTLLFGHPRGIEGILREKTHGAR